MSKDLFTLVGSHPEDLADGTVIEPGERRKLTAAEQGEDPAARLISEGLLIPIPEPEAKDDKKKTGGSS